jgi:hypothetical protein
VAEVFDDGDAGARVVDAVAAAVEDLAVGGGVEVGEAFAELELVRRRG